ncbi:WD repeat-containing protein 24 [Nowakowskiella sp. JEL0407]|nr:WD repeat-containing protein 24 [Nowakowskiella sp. JEL0407]
MLANYSPFIPLPDVPLRHFHEDPKNMLSNGMRLNLDSVYVGKPDFGDELVGSAINSPSPNQDVKSSFVPAVKYRTGGALTAMSASPDGERAIVAGLNVLQILKISRSRVQESLNLMSSSHRNNNTAITDVKWGNAFIPNIIATASNLGPISLWDLNRASNRLDRIMKEHNQAVHRILFHPLIPLLISASQDHSMKIWDIRTKKSAKHSLPGMGESVRDIVFNPVNSYELASAFDNGVIQTWDIRYTSGYITKWSAHNGLVLSVDWHSTGKYLVSGGRDRIIRVWDMATDNNTAAYNFQAIDCVSNLRWRPEGPDGGEGKGGKTVYQIASSSVAGDGKVYVWDLRRRNVPEYCIDEHDDVTTGILWQSNSKLWSCSKDKHFTSTSISKLHAPLSHTPTSVSAINTFGQLTFAVGTRDYEVNSPEVPRFHFGNEEKTPRVQRVGWEIPFLYWGLVVHGGKLVVSDDEKSGSEEERSDDVEILNSYLEIVNFFGIGVFFEPKIKMFRSNQQSGSVTTNTFNFQSFAFLAENYSLDFSDPQRSCEFNYQIAMEASEYRTAQTWNILSLLCSPDTKKPTFTPPSTSPTPQFESLSTTVMPNLSYFTTESNNSAVSAQNELEYLHHDSITTAHTSNAIPSPKTMSAISKETEVAEMKITTNIDIPNTPKESVLSPISGPSNFNTPSQQFISLPNPHHTQHEYFTNFVSATPSGSNYNNYNNPWDIFSAESGDDFFERGSEQLDSPVSVVQPYPYPNQQQMGLGNFGGGVRQRDGTSVRKRDGGNVNEGKEFFDENDADVEDDGTPPVRQFGRKLSESSFGGISGVGRVDVDGDGEDDSEEEVVYADSLNSFGIENLRLFEKQEGYREMQMRKHVSRLSGKDERFFGEVVGGGGEVGEEKGGSGSGPRSEMNLKDVESVNWNPWKVIYDVLDYYSEEGNVQMCVTMISVLRNQITISEDREVQWYCAYIDLLHRCQLWIPATNVIRSSPYETIRMKNQTSTFIDTACSDCWRQHEMENSKW